MISYPQKFESLKAEVLQRYHILEGSAGHDTNHFARTVALAFRTPIVIVALNERYRGWYTSSHGVDDSNRTHITDLCSLANLSDKPFVVEDAAQETYFRKEKAVTGACGIRFFAGIPLTDPHGKRFGTLCLLDRKPRLLTDEEHRLLGSFGALVSNDLCVRSASRYAVQDLIEAQEDKCALYDLAVTDPLTGCFNRRAFYHFSEREVSRAARHNIALTVVIFDIDHFKQVNDRYGHGVGDDVIRGIAQTVSADIREEDYFGRLGGEEFGLLLPETSPEKALFIVNRLRQKIRALHFDSGSEMFSVTTSFGVAQVQRDHGDIQEALERADQALYQAKRNGRDRIVLDGGIEQLYAA